MTAGVINVTADVIEGYRLSPQQERLWLLQRESPQAPYHVQCIIRIEGPFDLQRLHTALRHVVRHHEILRTTFQYVPGMTLPVQVIAESGNVSINEYDLVDLTPSEQAARIGTLFHESFQQPFNLTYGPLMHVSYGRLEATKHRLLINLPALCADRATLRNLAHEISQAYAACEQGKILTDVSLQYADFAEWQNALLEEQDSEAGRTYWRRLVDPTLLHNRLPLELQLGGTLGFTPRWLTVTIPSERVVQIDEVVQRYQTTASVFLLACWQILLQRLTGRTELLTGLTCEGRKYKEFKEALGPYAKSLPLRCSLNEHSRFSAIAAQLRDTTREIYEWQEYFTWEAIDELGDQALFFHLCFEFEDQPPVDTSGEPSFIVDEQYSCIDRFKVKLVGIREGDSIAATLYYDASLFQPEAMTCLAEQLKTLIASAVHDPEAPVKELEILSEAEHQRVVIALNQTQANYPQDQSLHHLFEAQVARTPEATALVYEHQSFSYTELNRRANQLVHYLRGHGVGPDVLVGLCVERSPELIVGLLGILKAGGAYVPIDPDYPKERIAYLLEDAQVSLLLTQQRLLASLPETATHIVCLDWEGLVLTEHSVGNPSTMGTPDHLAYVIYTSGSTGRPKGVQITHRNAVHSTHARLRYYSDPITSFLLLSSFAFDSSVAGIFWTLSQGGTLCLVQEGLQKNPEALAELIAQQQVSHLLSLPPFYRLLLEQLPRHRLSSLCAVIVAGEACPCELMVRHHASLPAARIFNEYGPTEGTVWSSVYESRSSDINLPVPIGRPITNMQVYLLDKRHKPVPIGIPGELYIGGVGLARGYLNRSELTAERFIPSPFGDPGSRLYRTGDLARYLPDGNIEFLGRMDHQVKVRGFRIELGEIEARLLEHPEVRAAVVVAREDSPGDKRLVAYVVSTAARPMVDGLRAHMKAVLPEYMVPAAFVFLEALPLTPNGKVDRNALPVPDIAGQLARRYVAPHTSTEELLAGIWAEVLGLERVGIHDNFFELGGHSLLVSRLGFKIRDTFKVDLPIRSIFKRPTISELAHLIRNDNEYCQYQTDKIINLDLEAKLDPAIRPSFVSVKQTLNPGVVLVTGATGFLGVFLVHELLQQTGAKIYCLVRAETIDSAWQKLKTQMSRYEVWDSHFCCRLVPVCGDLSTPYLGLPRHQFEELAGEVEVIYHNGAQVNFVYPYHILKPANVLGTQEILRLACTNRLKTVHYVSALSVLRNETNLISEQVTEDYFPEPNSELSNGYAQSKWVAEKLVRIAGDRGVPICIYRPGQISGHSYTGVCNTDDFMCRMIKSYVDLGKAPLEELILDMAPVDHVSKAIVFLSTRSASLGCTFHLNNPNLISIAHIINWFSSAGFVIKKVSFAEWWSEINVIVKDSYNHPLYPLISYFEDTSFDQQETSAQKVHYNCRKTLQALEGSSIVCPDINDEIFHRYISYFIRSGFIKAPILKRSDFN